MQESLQKQTADSGYRYPSGVGKHTYGKRGRFVLGDAGGESRHTNNDGYHQEKRCCHRNKTLGYSPLDNKAPAPLNIQANVGTIMRDSIKAHEHSPLMTVNYSLI